MINETSVIELLRFDCIMLCTKTKHMRLAQKWHNSQVWTSVDCVHLSPDAVKVRPG